MSHEMNGILPAGLATAIKRLQEEHGPRGDAKLITSAKTPRTGYLVRDGELLLDVKLPAPLIEGRLGGVEDLVTYALDGDRCPNPEVFVGERFVSLGLDRDDGREWMRLDMQMSARFTSVSELALKPFRGGPREVTRFLRIELGVVDPDLLAAFSRLDFSRKSTGARTAEHGRESLGKDVEASVQQHETVPKVFKVSVPVFLAPGCRGTEQVEVDVFLDVFEDRVELSVSSDSISLAVMARREVVRASLDEKLSGSAMVLLGDPGARGVSPT